MDFIKDKDYKIGREALAQEIISFLNQGKKVLWLIPGGSNIPIAVYSMNKIQKEVKKEYKKNLSITLTDERYGALDHPDSNWKQLIDANLDISNIKSFPVLKGDSLQDTVKYYSDTICDLIKNSEIVIGQFGMGSDGHIAGILPHTVSVSETGPVSAYTHEKYSRITLTFPILKKIDIAYLFTSESSKKEALDKLKNSQVPLDEEPAQILKEIPRSSVYLF